MNRLARILSYLKLMPRLGLANVIAVAHYRHQWRSGELTALLPVGNSSEIAPFWYGEATTPALAVSPALAAAITQRADAICAGRFERFGDAEINEGETPVWHKTVYAQSATQHFTHAAINAVAGGDAKLTWDLSRMHWAPRLALAACVSSGDARDRYLNCLDHLTRDWLTHNPYQCGVNWACAHEVSLRGMQLLLTSMILEKHLGLNPSQTLLNLMEQSWRRVYAVRRYARAQQNNHSLAEHLFLIYAAAFLTAHQVKIAPKNTLTTLHRALAPLVDSLIMKDGGSVMYSANYHRVFCDMLSVGKIFDDHFALGLFSQARIQTKYKAAFDFLDALIEPISGEMPLIGHNDGSLHCVQFSNFHSAEPSLLVMGAAFGLTIPECAKRHEDAVWLFDYTPHYHPSDYSPAPTMQCFDDFGLTIFSTATTRAYVKYPRHHYRPAQCDFGHFDLWVHGKNILHDSGTYSYNPPKPSPCEDLSDLRAHNAAALATMPVIKKLSPFLYAFWPHATVTHGNPSLTITVPLSQGSQLHRTIDFTATQIILTDFVHSTHPWQVQFHGALSASAASSATIADGLTMQFKNIETLAMTDSLYAPNYHTLTSSKRLTVTPQNIHEPIITTITITA